MSNAPRLRRWLDLGIPALLLMLLLVFTGTLLLAGGGLVLWLMQAVPLLLLWPGLWHMRRRALQWLGFLLLFNFTIGILQLFSPDPPSRALGLATAVGCLLLFTAAIVRLNLTRQS